MSGREAARFVGGCKKRWTVIITNGARTRTVKCSTRARAESVERDFNTKKPGCARVVVALS